MLLEKFKKRILSKDFQKKLRELPHTRVASSNKIQTIGILTTDTLSSELSIEAAIKHHFNTVTEIQMYSFKKSTKKVSTDDSCFTEQDFNWRGGINDARFERFLETPFDLLIGYFDEQHLFLELALFTSSATFKIGFSQSNDLLYDMIVHERINNISGVTTLIDRYLKILKKL